MSAIIIALRLLAVSQALLCLFALAYSPNPRWVRILGCLFAAGVCGYLLGPLLYQQQWLVLAALSGWLASLAPALLLLFTWAVFEDDQAVEPWVWAATAVFGLLVSGAELWNYFVLNPLDQWLRLLVQISKLGFVLAAIGLVWRGHGHDLVESRLRLRRLFVIAVSVVVATVVLVELVTNWQVPQPLEALGMGLIFIFILACNLIFIRLEPAYALAPPMARSVPITESNTTDTVQDPLVSELLQRMRQDRLYADHDLRIGTLAHMLGVPEHRLRKLINQQLGYRNFNQFVNRYRIAEAAERLRGPESSAILTIALDVGFRSISSFNTAFRAAHGCSASVYREQPSD